MQQILATDHSKSRKMARFESRAAEKPAMAYNAYVPGVALTQPPASQPASLSPTPSVSERAAEEGALSSYNLRHKSSQSASSAHGDEVFSPPPLSLSPLEKNNPQNAIMDCPFCQKSGYCGLPGIRTHIRNYCPSIDKMIWREKFLKCVVFNIHKYEELNRQPDANTEYNNMVIALLKAKSNPDDPMGVRAKGSLGKSALKEWGSEQGVRRRNVVVGVMNPIQYEKSPRPACPSSLVYCQHCHDENSSCPHCGCHVRENRLDDAVDVPFQAPGLPAHDLRRVQQGAPHLLRLSAYQDHSRWGVVLPGVPEEGKGDGAHTVRGLQLHRRRERVLLPSLRRDPDSPGDGAEAGRRHQADGFSACFAECERPSASSILWDVNGSGSSRSFCCLC